MGPSLSCRVSTAYQSRGPVTCTGFHGMVYAGLIGPRLSLSSYSRPAAPPAVLGNAPPIGRFVSRVLPLQAPVVLWHRTGVRCCLPRTAGVRVSQIGVSMHCFRDIHVTNTPVHTTGGGRVTFRVLLAWAFPGGSAPGLPVRFPRRRGLLAAEGLYTLLNRLSRPRFHSRGMAGLFFPGPMAPGTLPDSVTSFQRTIRTPPPVLRRLPGTY